LLFQFLRNMSDIFPFINNFSLLFQFLRNISDIFPFIKNFSLLFQFLRNISDIFPFINNFSLLFQFLRNISDIFPFVNNFSLLFCFLRNISDIFPFVNNFSLLFCFLLYSSHLLFYSLSVTKINKTLCCHVAFVPSHILPVCENPSDEHWITGQVQRKVNIAFQLHFPKLDFQIIIRHQKILTRKSSW